MAGSYHGLASGRTWKRAASSDSGAGWADRETGEPILFEPHKRPGEWRACGRFDSGAQEDLNRLTMVAFWDKHKREWVDTRN